MLSSYFFPKTKPKESTIDSESESDTSDFLYQLMNSILKNPQSLSNAIEKLNKSDITNFLINILHEIDTDEFRNNLSIIFNNETIMDSTFHIFQKFFTSAKQRNSVVNRYMQRINPMLSLFLTDWVTFGTSTIPKRKRRNHRIVIQQMDNEDTQKHIYKKLLKRIKKQHDLRRDIF